MRERRRLGAGDPAPSAEDIQTTAGVMRAGKAVSSPLSDHVIVTRERHRYHSMNAKGTLPRID